MILSGLSLPSIADYRAPLSNECADGHSTVIPRIQALIDEMEREQVRLLASRDLQSHTFLWTSLAAGFIINAVAIALLIL